MKLANRAHHRRQQPRSHTRRGERGSATVELAISLPTVVALLLALLLAGHVIHTQLQCTEASRVAARVIALGESEQTAHDYVTQIVGPQAQLHFRKAGDGDLHVEVSRNLIAWSSILTVRSQLQVPWELTL